MSYKIVDVSHHNDNDVLEGLSIDGVMIRALSGTTLDKKVAYWRSYCKNNNIPYGYYIYSYATTTKKLSAELTAFEKFLESTDWDMPDLPVAFDYEDADGYKLKNGFDINKEILKGREFCDMACHRLEEMGCYAMIYASDSLFRDVLNCKNLEKYDTWIARWSSSTPVSRWGMWQFTDRYLDKHLDCSLSENKYVEIVQKMYEKNGVKTRDDRKEDAGIKKGDKVRVTSRIDVNGTKLAEFVLKETYDVIQVSNNEVVIGKGTAVTARIHSKDCVKIG